MDIYAEVQRAIKYTTNKEYRKAKKIYLDILSVDKENAVVLSMLGLLYLTTCHFSSAEKYLMKSYRIKPLLATTEGLGLVYFYMNDEYKAIEYFEKIINETKNFDVYDKYIKALCERQKFKRAYEIALEFQKMFPLKPDPLSNIAYCAINIGKLNEAYTYAEKVTKVFPKHGNGWITFGIINEVIYHDNDKAIQCYKKAFRCGEKFTAYYNLAIVYSQNKDYKKSLYYLRKVYNLSSDKGAMNFAMASIYFKSGQFKKAFSYYVHKNMKFEQNNLVYRLKHIWDGKVYKNETVLVYCDQGAGDCIMFARYIPFLEKKFKRIKVLGRESINGILKRTFKNNPKIDVLAYNKRLPHYDKSVVLSNLPYYLKMWDIPCADGYLTPDRKIIEKYKNLTKTDKLKVGICWEAGGVGLRDLIFRTMHIKMFESMLNMENVQFYSFQVKPTIDEYKHCDNLIDLGEGFNTYDDTAGALMNMDLVVTVDTSVAHLAGALGVRTFMLLPYVVDWRWFDNNETTEWYNSIKIFRQKTLTSWDDVFDSLHSELEKLVKKS